MGLSGGTTTYSTPSLTVGSHSVTAIYSGDSNYAGQTSDLEPFNVSKGNLTLSTTMHNAAHAVIAAGLWGAKITGGGAGGTVAVLGSNTPAAASAFTRVVEQYRSWSGKEPYVFQGSSAGCDSFGVVQVCY